MTDNFKPRNTIQKLAFEKRSITSHLEFEKMIGAKPWQVPRTTARYWWVNGIKSPKLSSIQTLTDFLRVPMDDLVK